MASRVSKTLRSVSNRLLGPRKPIVIQVGKDGQELIHPRKLGHFPNQPITPGQTRWPWPSHLDTDRTSWLRTLRRLYDHPLSFPFSLSPESGLLLHSVILNSRPRTVIEVGSNIGISTLWIAGAMHESALRGHPSTLWCFDDFKPMHRDGGIAPDQPPDREKFLRDALTEAGVAERTRIVAGDSAANIRTGASGMVQFAFIDGDHSPEGVLDDFLAVEPLLDTGGMIALHDTFPWMCDWTGPRRLLNTLHQQARGTYQTIDLYLAPVNYGLALLRRVG